MRLIYNSLLYSQLTSLCALKSKKDFMRHRIVGTEARVFHALRRSVKEVSIVW